MSMENGPLKTLWDKEKMLVNSISSFYHNVFYPLTLYQTTKFWTGLNSKHLHTINQNAIEKLKFVLGKVENMVGRGENAGFPAFSPVPTMFTKGLFLRGSLKVGIVW